MSIWALHTVTVLRENDAEKEVVAEDTNTQCFSIMFWNHLKYLNYAPLYFTSFFPLACLLCCALMFCHLLSTLWLKQGLHSFTRSTKKKKKKSAHARSSFNICSNPSSSCRLNGSYFWYFSLLLMLQLRRHAGVSHPPVLSAQKLSFHNTKVANNTKHESKVGMWGM